MLSHEQVELIEQMASGVAMNDEAVDLLLDGQCPGGHATLKDGDVHTCGPMLASMKGERQGTCGCILRRKARDLSEQCPFGWWQDR